MKRLLFSTFGVILTFIWIIYTAPPRQTRSSRDNRSIKTINRSGAGPLNKVIQPIHNRVKSDKPEGGSDLLVSSGTVKLYNGMKTNK